MTRPDAFAAGAAMPVDRQRYHRQMLLPDVGLDGQQRLAQSRVLVVGVGGLGSAAAFYLAAAGVGRLELVDADVVALSNLHRQVVHTTARIGMPKVESARQTLTALNPDCHITTHAMRCDARTAHALVSACDVVVDGSDNFATRYVLSAACTAAGRPHVYGSVQRWGGQVAVFCAGRGACYRCLYPEPPPPDVAASCAEAGILGVVPGLIGLLQATEVLKWLLGAGDPLIGRLLRYDALTARCSELQLVQDPACACASERVTQT